MTGEWLDFNGGKIGSYHFVKCSNCECVGYKDFQFCPHCGTRMINATGAARTRRGKSNNRESISCKHRDLYEGGVMIKLTKAEAEALKKHLEWYIIQEIKDSDEYDNIDYLISLIHVLEKCKAEEE